MTRGPLFPDARAAAFTAVCVALAMAAHRAMSDTPVPAWALVAGALGVFAAARIGAGRERGPVGIALVMVVFQIALHLLFGYAQDLAKVGTPVSMPTMPMPAGSSMPMPAASAAVRTMSMPGGGAGMDMGTGMLFAHALAALICAWWLHRGEAAVHELALGAADLVVAGLLVPLLAGCRVEPGVRRPERHVEPVALALHSQWLRTSRVLRGPPRSPSFA